jgi:hypothetical protein
MVRVRPGLTSGLAHSQPIRDQQLTLGPDTGDEDQEDSIVVLGDDDEAPTRKKTKRVQISERPVNAVRSSPKVSDSSLLSSFQDSGR